jgi:hypothetical protein
MPGYRYPAGMKTSLDPEVETVHGRPVQGISFTSPADLGRAIPLQVVAEVTLPDDIKRFAELLGARQSIVPSGATSVTRRARISFMTLLATLGLPHWVRSEPAAQHPGCDRRGHHPRSGADRIHSRPLR